MNILWLDDDINRTNWFKSKCPAAICVDNAKDCIEQLKQDIDWQYIFLDHDLGGEIFVETNNKNTGSEVVRWIIKNKPTIDVVIVHSHNPAASSQMQEDLLNSGYETLSIPFSLLQTRISTQI